MHIQVWWESYDSGNSMMVLLPHSYYCHCHSFSFQGVAEKDNLVERLTFHLFICLFIYLTNCDNGYLSSGEGVPGAGVFL